MLTPFPAAVCNGTTLTHTRPRNSCAIDVVRAFHGFAGLQPRYGLARFMSDCPRRIPSVYPAQRVATGRVVDPPRRESMYGQTPSAPGLLTSRFAANVSPHQPVLQPGQVPRASDRPLRWALQTPPARGGGQVHKQSEQGTEEDSPQVYVCAACQLPVTQPVHRIEMAGSHRHVFVNPHGLDFEIGCFSVAAGAVAVGRATEQFSWFPGAPWRVACCRGCGIHLGWAYGRGGIDFFGLIFAALRLRDAA